MLKIIADENIVFAEEAFSGFGEVQIYPGRKLSNQLIKNTDVLIVRSITKVDEHLLKNTTVKFVGSATTGSDHIDGGYLKRKNIFFADAKGCNSYSVVEYLFTAILKLASENNLSLMNKTLAVIGNGNIGSKVVSIAKSLGLKVLVNDPLLERTGITGSYVSLDDALGADIITLHVPLTFEGRDKTYHLLQKNNLNMVKEDSILINTSRGEVIDSAALFEVVSSKKIHLILDVWENEPDINKELLRYSDIGTAHIAGYSYEGKVNGTRMIFDALCKFTGEEKKWIPTLPSIENPIRKLIRDGNDEKIFYNLLKSVYDIQSDDDGLRKILGKGIKDTGEHFDKLRKEYPVRREFNNYKIILSEKEFKLGEMLRTFRFQVELI